MLETAWLEGSETFVLWGSLLLQALALASVAIARCAEQSRWCCVCRRSVLGFVFVVGGAALLSLGCGHDCWLSLAVTLSLMALGATFDLGRSRHALATIHPDHAV